MKNILKLPTLAGLLSAFLILLCTVITETNAANNTEWAKKKIGGDARIGTAKWCGSGSSTIVWQGVTSGIHLADLSSGAVVAITQSWQHADPFCSPDGRFVFFMDESTNKTKAYDLNTSKITTIECLSNKVILSPDMRAAVSVDAKGCGSIDLPWGETIPIKRITGIQSQGGELSSVVAWFSDRQRVILSFIEPFKPGMFSQHISIAVYDFANAKLTPIQLPHNPFQIKVSEDGKHLFYIGENVRKSLNGSPRPSHLFKVDIEHIPTKAKQVQLSVSAFDIHPQHGMAILKSDGEILVGMPGNGGLKRVSRQKMDGTAKFSPDGHKLLLMRQDPFHGQDGPEGPPITSTVYVLFVNQK